MYIYIYAMSHYLWCGFLWLLVCSAMKLDDSWASLVGIDRVGSPDPDPIHMYTTCVMFKCYHAIRNDYATILDGCITHNVFSEIHSKTIFLARLFATDCLCWLNELNMTLGEMIYGLVYFVPVKWFWLDPRKHYYNWVGCCPPDLPALNWGGCRPLRPSTCP